MDRRTYTKNLLISPAILNRGQDTGKSSKITIFGENEETNATTEWSMYKFDKRNTGNNTYAYPPKRNVTTKWSKLPSSGGVTSYALMNDNFGFFAVSNITYALGLKNGESKGAYGRWFIYDHPRSLGPVLVDDNKIIIPAQGYEDHETRTQHIRISLFDIESGNEIWKFETGFHDHNSVVVHDGSVYFTTEVYNPLGYSGSEPIPRHEKLYSVDLKTGEENWNIKTDGRYSIGDEIVIKNGNLITYLDGLAEISPDGEILQSNDVPGTDLLMAAHDRIYSFSYEDTGPLAYDLEEQNVVWSNAVDTGSIEHFWTAMVADSEFVYATTMTKNDEDFGEDRFKNKYSKLYKFDREGTVVWKKGFTDKLYELVGARDMLYVTTFNRAYDATEHLDEKVMGLSKEDGSIVWTETLTSAAWDGGIAVTDKGLLVPTHEGAQLITGDTDKPKIEINIEERRENQMTLSPDIDYEGELDVKYWEIVRGGEIIHKSEKKSFDFQFKTYGKHTIKLIVEDEIGRSITKSVEIEAEEPTPTPTRVPTSSPTVTPTSTPAETPVPDERQTPTQPDTPGDTGPGFGIGTAIGGIGALVYLLRQYFTDENAE